MLEGLHRAGSRLRHARFLREQRWLWGAIEPAWQKVFGWVAGRGGYATRINDEVFKLVYDYGARYDRADQHQYEPIFYRAFVGEVVEGMTVFDIGAHIGLFTLGAARRVGARGRVVAFEPAPESAAILARHVRFNHWPERVEVVRAVVSDVDGEVTFYAAGASMAASLGRENVEVLNQERLAGPARALQTPSITLDEFCRARRLRPQVIKIDVEGAELHVLRGAERLLRAEPVMILCEVHPQQMEHCGASLAEFEAYLRSVGYGARRLDEPGHMGVFHSLITKNA